VIEPVRGVPGVERVDIRGGEVVVSVNDGPTAISPIAVALNGCGVKVTNLSLRTPTLDDVFLEITGGHLQEDHR
jgi:ABC-2 type transport system ATP-binding protein